MNDSNLNNFYSKKKVLVTGGAGFVGSNLLKKLIEFDLEITSTFFNSKPKIISQKINYLKADLRDTKISSAITRNIDYIFMCSANSSGANVISKTPLVHLTPNLVMNLNVLESAYKNKVKKFLFISSNTVYPEGDNKMTENDVNNTFYKSYYVVGWMKRFTEIVCDMYSNKVNNPMQTIIVRPSNLYGPYDKFDWEKSKVIAALIRRAVETHDPYFVWGDGNDIKDFLYIEDFIDGIIKALAIFNEYKVINLSSGTSSTINDIISILFSYCNLDKKIIKYDLSKPRMIPKRFMDNSLAKHLLKWTPSTDLELGIIKTLEWYKLNGNM